MSPTWRMTAPGSASTMSRVTFSSSDCGVSEFVPGVSTISGVPAIARAIPRVISTVVPG